MYGVMSTPNEVNKNMSAKPIDPLELKPKELKQALDALPEALRSKIAGIIKTPEIVREDQSPEAIRKANLRALRAKRRDLISSLIDLEKEIFLTEDLDNAVSFSPELRRAYVRDALENMERQLGSRSFLLSEVRTLHPSTDITFASWVLELTTLAQEGCIFFSGDQITNLKSTYRRS